ncbi:MAG: endolytic transglycosylase MltG [Acidobacteriaceae bacterium]
MVRGFLLFVLVVLLAVLGGTAYLIYTPFGPGMETFVEIAPGTSTPTISAQLQAQRVIRNRYAFDLLKLAKRGRLKAGEYRFEKPATMLEVYERLERGDVYTRVLVIPEGYNLFDIARAVEAAGLGRRDTFLRAEIENVKLIHDLNPEAQSLEGYLFPDTYHFPRSATPLTMLTVMVKRFRQEAAEIGLTENVSQTVTLASLIEKETGEAEERPLVASVFENRLAKGMPLATDPSVIYAALLEGRYRGAIYASDLQSNSAYNTYKHTGLPPGPICNPGVASLKAAMHPAETGYLYFVSDDNGHSVFSETLTEHAQHVQEYRKAERLKGQR